MGNERGEGMRGWCFSLQNYSVLHVHAQLTKTKVPFKIVLICTDSTQKRKKDRKRKCWTNKRKYNKDERKVNIGMEILRKSFEWIRLGNFAIFKSE